MSKFLDREAILGRTALPSQEITVPEWSGTIRIRCMSVGEREQFEKQAGLLENTKMRELVVAWCVCDENGTLLFAKDDLGTLSQVEARVLDRIFAAAVILNGIGRNDIAELKKTFEKTQSGDSSSSSPATLERQLVSSNGT